MYTILQYQCAGATAMSSLHVGVASARAVSAPLTDESEKL